MFDKLKQASQLAGMLKDLPRLQAQMEDVRARLANTKVEGSSGGGAVRAVACCDLRIDPGALVGGHGAHLHHRIDEEAQALLGGNAARTGMGREDEARVLQIHHHVAHRGGREIGRQDARNGARPNGFAGFEIGVDEAAEDLARALVEPGDAAEPLVRQGLGRMGRDHAHGHTVEINLAEVNQRG